MRTINNAKDVNKVSNVNKINPINPDEDQFLIGLLELQYDSSISFDLISLTQNIPWAKGWPSDNRAFWNAESFMWSYKIDYTIRDLISKELEPIQQTLKLVQGKNLDLGCGNYSYIPSVGFDISEKMLNTNENLSKKIQGDLEHKLPFPDSSFESITAIFVFNYVQNYLSLLKEVRRTLKPSSFFIIVLSSKNVKQWHQQKQINLFSKKKWIKILEQNHFIVDSKETDHLMFFKCQIEK